MLMPCEIVVKSVLPGIRAMVAKELISIYDLKQVEVADLMGVTQAAVSQYVRGERGAVLDLEEPKINELISTIAVQLKNDKTSRQEIISSICGACRIIRDKGLMCDLHKQLDPYTAEEDCKACLISQTDSGH